MRSLDGGCAIAIALLIAVAALVAALAFGTEIVPPQRIWLIFVGDEASIHADIVLGLRMPRALTAFACGGLLAVAGALMQVMLRNPLADPYVLGLAGGAGTGALAAMLAGVGSVGVLAGAWAGALASVGLVLTFGGSSFRGGALGVQGEEPLRLLLTGVALASGWAALIALALALAPDASLRGMLFWLMGDLDGAESFGLPLSGLAGVLLLALLLARDLNVLSLGADVAHALGVSVGRIRLCVLLLASGATALAVTACGTLAFIGLIIPNAIRLVCGNDQRLVLPMCALCGGAFLTAADTVARSALSPLQLPVGAIIALAGVPLFIALLSVARAAR